MKREPIVPCPEKVSQVTPAGKTFLDEHYAGELLISQKQRRVQSCDVHPQDVGAAGPKGPSRTRAIVDKEVASRSLSTDCPEIEHDFGVETTPTPCVCSSCWMMNDARDNFFTGLRGR